MKELKDYVITIPDFPKPGIMFRDITGILDDADGVQLAIDELRKILGHLDFDAIAGAESRGFMLGMPLAYLLHKPFIPIRKKGKLPRETISETYDLEYGQATIEIHNDSEWYKLDGFTTSGVYNNIKLFVSDYIKTP